MIDHPVAAAAIGVSILTTAFSPTRTDVVAGDTVTWSNDSVRRHTVTADDGSFGSPSVFPGDKFAQKFEAVGAMPYYCTVHPFMRGEVDVHSLLLNAPGAPAAPRRPYPLAGRSALPSGTAVSIEGDSGSGFAKVAETTVGDDGSFHASVVPPSATSYRAVSGAETTPAIQLLVLDRHITAKATRRGRRTLVRVRVAPASPHATVVLQLNQREHFGWWPVRRARLGHGSTATFRLSTPGLRLRARAVLTLPDGATQLARSGEFHVGVARSRPRR